MPQARRIPLDTAHQFLATFGINAPTATYNRWVQPDGIDATDLWHVLAGDSPFVLGFDWKSDLTDLSYLRTAVQKLDAPLESTTSEDGSTARVRSSRGAVDVKYIPKDDDDFADVIRAIQTIVPPGIEFRESPYNQDNDGWNFAVLPADEWLDLERIDRGFVLEYFRPLRTKV